MATKNNIWNGVFIFNNMLLIGFYILSYKKLYWEFFHIYIYIKFITLYYMVWEIWQNIWFMHNRKEIENIQMTNKSTCYNRKKKII